MQSLKTLPIAGKIGAAPHVCHALKPMMLLSTYYLLLYLQLLQQVGQQHKHSQIMQKPPAKPIQLNPRNPTAFPLPRLLL
jgi:hypothetical protein